MWAQKSTAIRQKHSFSIDNKIIFSVVFRLHQMEPFVSPLLHLVLKCVFFVMAFLLDSTTCRTFILHLYYDLGANSSSSFPLILIKSLPTPLPLQPCSSGRILCHILLKPQHKSNKEKVVAVREVSLLHRLHPSFPLLFLLHLMAVTPSEWMSSSTSFLLLL